MKKSCSCIPLYLYTLFLAFALFSCGSPEIKSVDIPSDILPKDKMAIVILDIHLAEAEASMRTLPDSTSTEKLGYQKIFDKHQVTRAQYDASLTFYIEHPELLNEVYEIVLNDLSRMQVGEPVAGEQ
jgi:hypothetical protein